jgi:plasmid stability protein
MRNITISLDDEVYRQARIKAAEQDTSVSALVRKYLVSIAGEAPTTRDLKQEQEALLDSIGRRHPGFTSANNVSRDALHDRNAVR